MSSTSNPVEKGKGIDPENSTDDNFVEEQPGDYKKYGFREDALWEAFHESLSAFSADDFEKLNSNKRFLLRDFLGENGVYVNKRKGLKVSQALHDTAQEEDQSIWPQEEVDEIISKGNFFNSYLAQAKALYNIDSKFPKPENQSPKFTSVPQIVSSNNQIPSLPSKRASTNDHDTPTYYAGRELADTSKSYTEKIKYGGGEDRFDHKLTIFYDQCRRFNLEQDKWIIAFPIMLKDDALDYYYDDIQPVLTATTTFFEVTSMIRDYFEEPEFRREVQQTWHVTNLTNTISNNPEKSIKENFESMLKILKYLEKG